VGALFTALGFAVRAVGLSRSFELGPDEVIYADLGTSVSRGHLPALHGQPFFLHPPGFFVLEGVVIKVLGLQTQNGLGLVFELRWLNAVLGALTVGLSFLLVRRVAGILPACLSAALLAFDPFVLRSNSRVMLETFAGVLVLVGLLLLVTHLQREPGNRSTPRLVLAGLVMGCGVLTKDIFLVYTALPVLLAMLWRRTLPRRTGAVLLSMIAVPYGVYVATLGSTGHLGQWWAAKASGLGRLLGSDQETGFNASYGPSLVSRALAQLRDYGTSYVLLLSCLLVGVVVARSARADRRLLGLTAVAMSCLSFYLLFVGTLEEQYGYGVLIASGTALGACIAELVERNPARSGAVLRAAGVFLALTILLGVRVESNDDHAYLTFQSWMAHHLPSDARVGVTDFTSRWAFQDDPRFGPWADASELRAHDAHYVLIATRLTTEGYGQATPAMLAWLDHNATVLFDCPGTTNGETVLFYLDQPTLDRAAALQVGSMVKNEP
jgi:hypothetical protein